MTIEEIRKNAPEGTTHYDNYGFYLMKTDEGWFAYSKLGYGWSHSLFILSEEQMEKHGIKPL